MFRTNHFSKKLLTVSIICSLFLVATPPAQASEMQETLQQIRSVLERLQAEIQQREQVLGVNSGDLLPLIEARGYSLSDIPVVEIDAMEEPYPSSPGTSYYLDANSGNDTTGDGSAAKPFKTVKQVWPLLEGGDTVKLASGDYGDISYNPYGFSDDNVVGAGFGSLFTDWVTFEATNSSAEPVFGNLRLNAKSETSADVNFYLKFKEITFRHGFYAEGGNNLALMDSIIRREEVWVAGDPRMSDKYTNAINVRGIDNLLIQGNDISNAAIGIATNDHTNLTIKDNIIHDLMHDGIRLVSSKNSLVEGNTIHSLDDGVDDDEIDGVNTISYHIDSLHIFQSGAPCSTLRPVENLIVRNNTFYDVESQHVQLNNYNYSECGKANKNIVFENNIFGPSGANAFNAADLVDGFVVRHNTFLPVTGRVYNSPFRSISQDNSIFRISDNYERVAIYNNILSNVIALDDGHIINDWNINWSQVGTNPAIGQNSQYDSDIRFSNLASFDGKVVSGSSNIDFGTKKYATSDLAPDMYGTNRDNRPDAGAYEVPGRNPSQEPDLPTPPENPTVFVDNFNDSNLDQDFYLFNDSTNQAGLSWEQSDTDNPFYFETGDDGARLHSSRWEGTTYVLSDQGSDWRDYTLEVTATNGYIAEGSGIMFHVDDINNHYFLDIARDAGVLYRVQNGVRTVLAENTGVRLPHSGTKDYKISVDVESTGTSISVDGGNDGSVDLTYTDSGSSLKRGGVGFYRDYDDDYHLVAYDNVEVLVSEFSDGTVAESPTDPVDSDSVEEEDPVEEGEDPVPAEEDPVQEEEVDDQDPASISEFAAGDRIKATDIINVRGTAGGTVIGAQELGALGTVLGATPVQVGDYVYISVNFDSAPVGWVADAFVSSYLPSTPTEVQTRAVTTDNLNVRSVPDGSRLGRQSKGSWGTVDTSTRTNTSGYSWVYVDFDKTPDGYVAEDYMSYNVTTGDGEVIDESAIRKLIQELLRLIKDLRAEGNS